MNLLILCLLFLNFRTYSIVVSSSYVNEIQNAHVDLLRIPRTRTYMSYQFPPRFDGSSFAISLHDDGDKDVVIRKYTNISYFNANDDLFEYWTDVAHNQKQSFVELDGFLAYILSNKVHRTVEYAGDDICNSNYQQRLGKRIVQMYQFSEFPYEYMINYFGRSLREFYYDSDAKRENSDGSTPLLSHFFSLHKLLDQMGLSMYNSHIAEHYGYSTTNHAPLHNHRGGRFQISKPLYMPHQVYKNKDKPLFSKFERIFYGGMTYQCFVNLDEENINTGVIVNIDHMKTDIHPESKSTKFKNLETWDYSFRPYEDVSNNLKIDVSWRNFSCCSACCCSTEICGQFASTRNCKSVISRKVRTGYLSIMKINPSKEITPNSLQRFLTISPYKEYGIPVYSTFFETTDVNNLIKDLRRRFFENNGITKYDGIGMYIEEKSCQNDPQKKDCYLLAKCKGIRLKNEETEEEEHGEDADECSNVNLTILTVKERKSFFKVSEGESYRIRLDSKIFNTDRGVKWKISLVKIEMKSNRECLDHSRQLHPNGKDILLIKLMLSDMNKRIEATTHDGTKVVIILKDQEEQTAGSFKTITVIFWMGILLGFLACLSLFVYIVEKSKANRIKRILKNRQEE